MDDSYLNFLLCYILWINFTFPICFFRLLKEFDREIKDEEPRNPPEVHKQLNDEKQSMVSLWEAIFSPKYFNFILRCCDQDGLEIKI